MTPPGCWRTPHRPGGTPRWSVTGPPCSALPTGTHPRPHCLPVPPARRFQDGSRGGLAQPWRTGWAGRAARATPGQRSAGRAYLGASLGGDELATRQTPERQDVCRSERLGWGNHASRAGTSLRLVRQPQSQDNPETVNGPELAPRDVALSALVRGPPARAQPPQCSADVISGTGWPGNPRLVQRLLDRYACRVYAYPPRGVPR